MSAPFLAGQVAVVTGSTKGIGRGIAEALAAAGSQVVVSSRAQPDCDRVAQELNAAYPATGCYGVRCDVSDATSIAEFVTTLERRSGGIDVLVCNAARMPKLQPFGEVADDEFLAQFDTNVVKALRLCMRASASMQRRGGGSIVLIGSRTGIAPAPQQLAYSCAKAAETHLARNLAQHLAPAGIRVNCIAPGLIDTPIYGTGPESDKFKAHLGESVLFPKRLGNAEELAYMVIECITNPYMNGETIRVDGGIRMPPR